MSSKNKSSTKNIIYILKLEKQKYYVGKTKDLNRRFDEHCEGKGSEWTNIYKPLSVIKQIQEESRFHEQNETIELMEKYGYENVRGGRFCNIELTKSQKTEIEETLKTLNDECYNCGSKNHLVRECSLKKTKNDRCYRCGRFGHFMGECFAKTDIHGTSLYSHENESLDDMEIEEKPKQIICYRCGRPNHLSTNCFAKTHIKGFYLK